MKTKLILLFSLTCLLTLLTAFTAQAERSGEVLILSAEGPVTPVMLNYIERGIALAEQQNAKALVIKLDTPGGQIDLTREIIQAIINADVPIAVYVYPPGATAASAGTFITLAGHVAAMAPNTSIGAASPIGLQGGEIDETLQAKIKNILVADIENLTERRGDAAIEWATEAVTEAKAANAKEALELGVIDFIALDVPDLLAQMDGSEVTIRGEPETLNTANAPTADVPMTFSEQILSVLLRPEIAFMLLALGPLAIIYEFSNPGGYIVGIIGVIMLVLGLFAMGQIPTNYAGIGLLILAFILFGAEVFTPTYGALSLAGVVSLVLAGLLLFDETDLGYQVPLAPIIATSVGIGLIFFFIVTKAVASFRMQPSTGAEGLIGATAIAKTDLDPTGAVFTDGARWNAVTGGETVEAGETVEIIAVEGLRLRVKVKETLPG